MVSGGVRQHFVYDGELAVSLDADLDKGLGWTGATAHASAIAVQGRGPSSDLLGGNLMDVSSIEARRGVRLYTLWLQQNFANDRLSVRAGQLAADDEFMLSDTAGNLMNGTFGWSLLASADMTAGGPAYPLPTPGVRVQVKPLSDLTVRAAVFSGNPGGSDCTDDAQVCNPHGTTFSFGGGALWMAEAAYAVDGGTSPTGLPGTYKLGGWHETGTFTDQLSGVRNRKGDFGIYGIVDQMVWRRPGTGDQGVSVFLRGGGAPADRNLVAWYVDGGLGYKGVFASRPDDTVTLGAAYGRISSDAADADRDSGTSPVRDYESVVELSYIAALAPWWTLQPDVQYVMHPGGNVSDPDGNGTVKNALVVGIRTSLSF